MALAAGCAAMLAACGGGGSSSGSGPATGGVTPAPSPTPTPTTAGCSLSARKDWVKNQLNEWYLFPSLLDLSASQTANSSLEDYIDALVAPARAQNRDRYFTYLTSIAEENAYYQQGQVDASFGFRLGYDSSSNRVFVIEAFEGAPALAAGIDRGVEIVQIGGQAVSTLMAAGGPYSVINALGADTVGLTRELVIRELSGTTRTVSLSKAVFALDPVSDRFGAKVIDDGGRKVGYLNLRTFIGTAEPDLRAAFADFKAQGVTELIIDFRYNGGGLIAIAAFMGDLMAAGRRGQDFGYITFRDSKSAENETIGFDPQPESITPTRVAFIGTSGTASASEMVINGMQPYLGTNMALIGSNTYGKPVGQIALDRPDCDDRLRAIALKIENANHQGEYYTGLASTVPNTCRAGDDIGHQLGDPNEAMVRTALDFLAGRSCTAIASASATATASISGKVGTPAPQKNLLTPAQPRRATDLELPGVH
ncbi:S41 family peptidase [Altererythrobacter sp. Root672]|uniref:S41 family peptidase n=1 Tax=Altererythrobacter sp. Root672 TaxID=1736584 RepID=UPI001F3F31D7|nr:S41 family peptidase [Altererythrobacter sp. Root672]